MSARFDVAVVGGGVVGLAVAWEATRRGLRVAVVERERVGGGATAVAGGMLAPTAEAEVVDPRFVALALESARLYPAFVAGVEAEAARRCAYRTEGTLLVALHRDHEAELERAATIRAELGLAVERLGAAALRSLEPRISPRAVGAWHVRGDVQVDPRALAAALAAALRRRGATLHEQTTVGGLDGDRLDLLQAGEAGTLRADHVVLAAGAWSGEALPGFPALPLRPVRGQVLRLRGETLLRHVVRTPDVYLVPRADGELLVGATQEEMGFDPAPTAGAVLDLLREARAALPGTYELALEGVDVGFRPALRDHLPAIGAVAPGRWVAVGHFRNGVLLAPVTARLLVDALVGEAPATLAFFSPRRFL